jgi:hypothetical protein
MELGADLTVIVGNKSFLVHRDPLIAKSKFFRNLLIGAYHDSREISLDMENIDTDVFQELIHLIYGIPYESSPSLMLLVKLYGVDADMNLLHEGFDVPAEQFVEYAEFMVNRLDASSDTRMIDRIVYNMPVGSDINILPQLIQEKARDSLWYIKWGTEYDTFNRFLVDHAIKNEKKHKKSHLYQSSQYAPSVLFRATNVYRVWLFVEALGQQRDREMHGNVELYLVDIARNMDFYFDRDDIPSKSFTKLVQYIVEEGKTLSTLSRRELEDIAPLITQWLNTWIELVPSH